MKKTLLFFTVLLLLSSCTNMRLIEKRVFVVDFSRYNERGFFLTESQVVPSDYIPAGIVSITLESGMGKEKFSIIEYTPYDALDVLCEELEKMGANGIVNMKLTSEDLTMGRKKSGELFYAPSYNITGMAIKKK